MMRRHEGCPYLNDVQAYWDGDLAEARATDLEAHLQGCPLCLAEQRALEQVAMTLRRGDADVSISKQQHEQQKSALLARAQRSLTPKLTDTSRPPAPRPVRLEWYLTAAVVGPLVVICAAILIPVFSTAREKARVSYWRSTERVAAVPRELPDPRAPDYDKMMVTPKAQPGPPAGGSPEYRAYHDASVQVSGGRAASSYPEPIAGAEVSIATLPEAGVRLPAPTRRSVSPGAGANAAKPVLNPNSYLSSTYIGGSGSRDRVEKLIREGVVVQGRRVKLEAFPRHYAQAFPIPTRTALNLIAGTERTKIVQQGSRTFLQVGLQAMKGEAPRRPPLNIALVIDCSGSMGDEQKLEYAKAAALQLVDRLRADDVVSLVAFDDNARLLVPAAKVRDRARLKGRLAALTPGSGTNIYAGLSLGHQEARKHASPDTVSRVILLSDGEVTAGVADVRQFQKLAAANVDRDIQTTAVGMGVQFNEELMLAVAREGKGNYHFLRDGADAQRVFAKELEELTHVVAKAVRLRIRLAEGVGLVRVLGAATLNDAQSRQVKAEEKKIDRKVADELGIAADRQRQPEEPGLKLLIPGFYRGDHHVVMLELAVPPGRGQRKVAEVFLKYKDLVGRTNRETQTSVSIGYTPRRDEMIASVDRNVKKNLLGFQTGEALAEAAALIERGRIAEAVRKIDERMVVLGVAAREWRDRDLDRDGRLLDRYKTVLTQLARQPQLASGEFGQYLRKSLTYAGYSLTR